tara:strand:+ start:337 stop:609 length:273 start_codon:yes stop_codon:yes gene_type:complete
MSVTYRPTHKFLGQNNVSLEYELRKLSQKIETISDTDSDIRAVASGAMAIATSAEVAVGAAASSAAVAANTAAITLLQNDLEAVRLGLWS